MTVLHERPPEQRHASISAPDINTEIRLSRPEIARTLGFVQAKYDFRKYLPPDIEVGLNLPTALAAMHAIDAKGQEHKWEYEDLLAALPVTRVALTTAGFAHAKEGVNALLTGTTGELQEITEKILPPEASKGIKWIAKTMVWVNAVDDMRVVAGLLIDEKKLEARLLRLTKLQQEMLLNPGRTRALLALLNGEYRGSSSLAGSGLPQEARTHLVRISPFSLEDMKAVNGLFNAVEWKRNSTIQIEAHRLQIETELKRLEAAGINVAKYLSGGIANGVEATLLISGGAVGAIAGGAMLAYNEGRSQIQKANDALKRKNEERKAAKVHTPPNV